MGKRRGHGEGSIFQRADGRWTASVDLGFVNGKRKRKWIYGKTRKEVADKLKALHRDQSLGINIAPEKQTVEQFLNRWLAYVKGCNRPRTYESYEGIVRLYILPHLGSRELSRLLPEHVDAMIASLKTMTAAKTGEKLAPRTVQYTRSVLVRALNRAVKWGAVSRNVALLTDAPSVPRSRITPLDEQEARGLLDTIKGHRLDTLYRIMLGLGLRRGEVLGLRWSDVDFRRRTLTISGALQRQEGKLERTNPKTDSALRTLPLPPELLAALEAHRQRQAEERAFHGDDWQEHDLVFPAEGGTPMEPRNLNRHFKRLLKKAGLPASTRLHDLRHACATFLIAQGVHPRIVMEILGHSQISVTMNTYGHALSDTQREALEKLNDMFKADNAPADAAADTTSDANAADDMPSEGEA